MKKYLMYSYTQLVNQWSLLTIPELEWLCEQAYKMRYIKQQIEYEKIHKSISDVLVRQRS